MTTGRLLLDTDVLIDYLRNLPQAVAYLESLDNPLYMSAITVAELYAGVREGRERAALTSLISVFEVVPIEQEIAERGGLLRRDSGKSHGTGLADAVIAATAEQKQATLVTLNRKHFPMLGRLEVPYEK